MIDFEKENETWLKEIVNSDYLPRKGKVHTIKEQYVITKGPNVKIGDICKVGKGQVMCEVVAIDKENNIMLPFLSGAQIESGDWVEKIADKVTCPVNEHLLGKVLDANGHVINENRDYPLQSVSLESKPINAFDREEISDVLVTGVKAIDGLLTIGIGQKIGIFAGSGVGKTTLLGMIAKKARADVNVIALVGERGREVKDFIRKGLGEEGLKRSVIVVATSDESRLMQLRCAKLATSIAERFRDEGKDVLLMMDSVTRFADARRDLDIATKDYPINGRTLSMADNMKKLLERSGKTKRGSITGLYTVLVDGDDENGAVTDMARGILDGHIVLNRGLATAAHYPAISILSSISRVMEDIVSKEHWDIANKVRYMMSLYEENESLFKMGALKETAENKHIFDAKNRIQGINEALRQDRNEAYTLDEAIRLFANKVGK